MAHEVSGLAPIVAKLKGRKIVVVGDLVLDEFIFGETKRVYGDIARTSREVAFGLMLRQRDVDRRPGGAANAINNLIALGAKPLPFGFVGDDDAGRWLRKFFRDNGVDVRGLRVEKGWMTPAKTRIVAGSAHSPSQQVLRLDREELKPPPARARKELLASVQAALKGADALLVADYGYGSAAPEGINRILKQAGSLPAVVDSRYRLREFRRASILTPSVPELEEAFRRQLGSGQAELADACRELLKETSSGSVLLTRGRHGMLLTEGGKKPQMISAFGSGQVADVTGAGDTVAATVTAALSAGAGILPAARLANLAAGLAVMKPGTATVSAAEVRAGLRMTE